MNMALTNNLMNEMKLSEQYRRQTELMFLKSYAAWLALREKTLPIERKSRA
jgi:hypothetical protein